MKNAVDRIPDVTGNTNISGALRLARQEIFNYNNGDRLDVRNVALIISDGKSNRDDELTHNEANALKVQGTRIYAVAVKSTDFNEDELQDIASDPDRDHYFSSPSLANLPAIRYSLLKHVCQQNDPFNS